MFRWRDQWTLLQYTALSWSRHGFPLGVLALLCALKLRHARLAVIFHDPGAYSGTRFIDRARRACQRWVMRTAYRWAERSIVNVPVERPVDVAPVHCLELVATRISPRGSGAALRFETAPCALGCHFPRPRSLFGNPLYRSRAARLPALGDAHRLSVGGAFHRKCSGGETSGRCSSTLP